MAALGTIATIATIAGTAVSAAGTIAAGRAQQAAANFEAAQYEIKAQEERAAAQREQFALKRKKNLALSRLQSLSAASGFDPTGPTELDITGEIAQYGTFQEQMARYAGESRAQGLRDAAGASRATGLAQRRGASLSAIGTILGGVSTMAERFAKYSQGGGGSAAPSYRYG